MSPFTLIVEPDARNRRLLEGLLAESQISYLSAENGKQAWEILSERSIEVLCTELSLPDRDGISLLAEARRARPGMAAIVMTERPSVESAVEALRNGVCEYLFKPLSVNKVHSAWQRAIQFRQRWTPQDSGPVERAPLRAPHFVLPAPNAEETKSVTVPLVGNLKDIERRLVNEVILRFDGNKTAAAKALGMHRKTLYRVLDRRAQTENAPGELS